MVTIDVHVSFHESRMQSPLTRQALAILCISVYDRHGPGRASLLIRSAE